MIEPMRVARNLLAWSLVVASAQAESPKAPTEEGMDNRIGNRSFENDTDWRFEDWDQTMTRTARAAAELVKGEFEGGARSGKRCIAIHRPHADQYAQFLTGYLTLESNAKYRLSGWMKSNLGEKDAQKWEGPTIFVMDAKWKSLAEVKDDRPGKTDWKEYAAEFTTGGRPEKVKVFCRLGKRVGSAWFDDVSLHKTGALAGVGAAGVTAETAPLFEAFLDRSYYTTEKTARLSASVRAAERRGARIKMALTDKDQRVLSREVEVDEQGTSVLEIDVSTLAAGAYPVTATLTGQGSKELATQNLELVKRSPPAKGSEVKIDRENRCLLVDGKPFFPVGFYKVPVDKLREFADFGCNSVIAWDHFAGLQKGLEYLDAAQKAGLKVIDCPFGRYMGKLRYADPLFRQKMDQANIEDLPKATRALRDYPALLAYYGADEPNLAIGALKGTGKDIVELCRDYCRTLNSIDPYHPVYGLFCASIPKDPAWYATYDCAGVDSYWCPLKGQTPLKVAVQTKEAAAITGRVRAPMLLVIQSTVFSQSSRSLTPSEQRCQTYLGLINGAKGMLYFTYKMYYRAMWDELRSLVAEMNRLAPVVLTATPEQEVTVTPDRLANSIQILAKRCGGKLYLLAVNTEPAPLKATFALPGVSAKEANVWFEDRRLPLAGSGLSDSFMAYGTHVYEMSPAPAGKIVVGLQIEIPPTKTAKAPARKVEPPKNNLVKNSGFEEDGGWRFTDWDQQISKTVRAAGDMVRGEIEGNACSGKRCAAIHRPHGDQYAQFLSGFFTLEPLTKYRLGAAVKTDIYEGLEGPTIFLMNNRWKIIGGRIQLAGKSVANPSGQSDWTTHAIRFTSGPAPEKVQVCCRLGKSKGSAWFDDVFLEKLPEGEVINLAVNGSFEQGVSGWPNYWQIVPTTGHPEMPMMGEGGAVWERDDAVAFHGKQSLRLRWTGPADNEACRIDAQSSARVSVAGGETYSFSVYLKGDRRGVIGRLLIQDPTWASPFIRRDVKVTDSWKRYTLVGKMAPKQRLAVIRFGLMSSGTLWVDAAQFETGDIDKMMEGNTKHPYVPDRE